MNASESDTSTSESDTSTSESDTSTSESDTEVVICTNPGYCPTRETFNSVEEFQRMVKACFGAEEVLTHQPGNGQWVDSTGERVLVSASRALREAVGDGLLETTFGDFIGLDDSVDAGPNDPVLVEAGWYAECDGAEVAYPWAMSANEAAVQYVEDGDLGEPGEGDAFVDVYTYRRGWVVDLVTSRVTAITIDRDRQRIALASAE